MSNSITIVGNVGTDPTQTILPGGARKVSFRVAVSGRYLDRKKNEWVDADPSWFTVEAFRALGDHLLTSVHRGDNVLVVGRLRVRTWETEKGRGTAVDIEAEAVGHNLAWGTGVFTRVQRADASAPSPTAAQQTPSDGAEQGDSADRGPSPEWPAPLAADPTSGAPADADVVDVPF